MSSNISVRGVEGSRWIVDDFITESVEMRGEEGIIHLGGRYEGYKMKVNMKNGKKEGRGVVMREGNRVWLIMEFENDIVEGEVIEMNERGNVVMRGRMKGGKENGWWMRYDERGEEKERVLFEEGRVCLSLKKSDRMKGCYDELNEEGEVIGSGNYDKEVMVRDGLWYEMRDGKVSRECLFKKGVMERVIREVRGNEMIEYDDRGIRCYEGGFDKKGDVYVRSGEGKEYGSDGESIVFVGMFERGERNGEGTLYKEGFPSYIGGWKNGLRDGNGKEYGSGMSVIREGKWIDGISEEELMIDRKNNTKKGMLFIVIGCVFGL